MFSIKKRRLEWRTDDKSSVKSNAIAVRPFWPDVQIFNKKNACTKLWDGKIKLKLYQY